MEIRTECKGKTSFSDVEIKPATLDLSKMFNSTKDNTKCEVRAYGVRFKSENTANFLVIHADDYTVDAETQLVTLYREGVLVFIAPYHDIVIWEVA